MLTQRIESIRKRLRETDPTICIERAKLVTDFYRQPSMDSIILRRAKMLEHILKNMTIYIGEGDLLAGHQCSRFRGVSAFPEIGATWMLKEIDTFETRTSDPLHFVSNEKEEFKEILEQWSGISFNEIVNSQLPEDAKFAAENGLIAIGSRNTSTGQFIPDYDRLLKTGLNWVIEQAEKNIESVGMETIEDRKKIEYWQALIIANKAVIDFASRYADLAENEAAGCSDDARKKELLRLAEICRKVPAQPPETFYEAVQFIWFIHLCPHMETNNHGISYGRFDQYLYPLYRKSIDSGDITEDEAAEILECLWLKTTELIKIRDFYDSQAFASYPMWQNLTVGGMTPEGKDACNDLTRLVLRVTDEVETVQPSVSFRWHRGVDQATYEQALKITQRGVAMPAFYNDSLIIPTMLIKGATLKEARDWAIDGCVEPYIPGKEDGRPVVGYMNAVKILEMTLNNGFDPVSGRQLGPETGDPRECRNMDEFMELYKKQMQYFNEMMLKGYNTCSALHAEILPVIFTSGLVEGCIEKGKTLQEGGAKYNFSGSFITAPANAADSLAVIEQVVFKNKEMSMDELIKVLADDYEGHEDIRQMFINRVPKFGNDIDDVDKYAHDIVDMIVTDTERYTDPRGGKYVVSIISQSYNVLQGKSVGATPDGRKAFTPLADNASPMMSRDVNGPTAAVRSVSKIDQFQLIYGTLLNQKFDPTVVRGEKGLKILESVVTGYFTELGQHIQINVIDKETLYDAKKNPSKYPNLMVRVAGYSAYFVDLDPEVQQNIIDRTEQSGL